jgi:hypothetical protein
MRRTLLDQWLDQPLLLRCVVYVVIFAPVGALIEALLTSTW